MSSGKDHDQSTKRWAIPFGLVIGAFFGLPCGFIAAGSFLFGGYCLSPDLDTKSITFKRWGYIKFIWIPYQKFLRHRSIFSHGPLIGTAIRLLYLLCIVVLFLFLLSLSNMSLSINILKIVIKAFNQYPKEILSLIIGIEGSALLHIIKDGDPLPAEWHK